MIKNFLKLDWVLNFAVFILLVLGLVALYSISTVDNQLDFGNFKKQLASIVIGLVLFFIFAFSDYRLLNFLSTKLYFVSAIVLVAVLFFGSRIRGTTGWIGFGAFHIQPVEIVKIVMIIFLASFLAKKKMELSNLVKIIASVIMIFIPIILILKQPDFGSASIIIATWIAMLLISGINKKNILALFLIGTLAISSGWFFLKEYQKDRLVNFINPFNDPQGSGYNVIQSVVAVGSGGIWGKGLGHGSQSQLNFLPEKHTDFIFAVITEELGFFGAALILTLFFVIFLRIRKISRLARDNFGYLLSVGIATMIFMQVFINIGMNIGVAPVAGVPLPLLSYGGSSLVAIMASLGIIQSIYLRRIKALD